MSSAILQKNPRVRIIFVRNSGAGNGCANFMGTWKNCVLSVGKAMSIKFLVLGGGILGFRGGSADFIFMGARIFLNTFVSEGTRFCARCCLHSRGRKMPRSSPSPPHKQKHTRDSLFLGRCLGIPLVARAIRNAIRANRFAQIDSRE